MSPNMRPENCYPLSTSEQCFAQACVLVLRKFFLVRFPLHQPSHDVNSIILVCGFDGQHLNHWDSVNDLLWWKERLAAHHTEAHIMAYRHEDLTVQPSLMGTVDKAARDLLSQLNGTKTAKHASSCKDLSETEDLSSLDPGLPVLFICRGFAGLVVKRVLMLNVVYARLPLS